MRDLANGYESVAAQYIAGRGSGGYRRVAEAAGLTMVGETEDEGENRYYMAFWK